MRAPTGQRWRSLDRILGRVYTRFLGVLTGVISVVMLLFALAGWRTSGLAGAWIWLLGALVFGFLARASWRSRAALSDVDMTT